MVQDNLEFKCPSCGNNVEAEENLRIGDIIFCPECEEELKVVRTTPFKVKKLVDIPEVYSGSYSEDYAQNFAQDYNLEYDEKPESQEEDEDAE